jgi:hypothetical protein
VIVKREDFSETAVRECRLHFLQAAVKCPQIRLGASLHEEVFQPSRKRWAELGLPVPQKPSNEWTPEQDLALQSFVDDEARLIEEWARKHNLNYEWVHSAVTDQLGWESFPKSPFSTIPGYRPPDFIWTAWHYGHESESRYRRRIRAIFEKTLEVYTREVKFQRGRFLKDRGSQAAHYCWAAQRVCLGWSWSRIARENGALVSWQAVRKAVLPKLERIGIPLATTQRKHK